MQSGGLVLQILSKICVAVTLPVPAWVRGARVHGAWGSLEALLDPPPAMDPRQALLSGPEPDPWWSPVTAIQP